MCRIAGQHQWRHTHQHRRARYQHQPAPGGRRGAIHTAVHQHRIRLQQPAELLPLQRRRQTILPITDKGAVQLAAGTRHSQQINSQHIEAPGADVRDDSRRQSLRAARMRSITGAGHRHSLGDTLDLIQFRAHRAA